MASLLSPTKSVLSHSPVPGWPCYFRILRTPADSVMDDGAFGLGFVTFGAQLSAEGLGS